jgi:hypothetical protein
MSSPLVQVSNAKHAIVQVPSVACKPFLLFGHISKQLSSFLHRKDVLEVCIKAYLLWHPARSCKVHCLTHAGDGQAAYFWVSWRILQICGFEIPSASPSLSLVICGWAGARDVLGDNCGQPAGSHNDLCWGPLCGMHARDDLPPHLHRMGAKGPDHHAAAGRPGPHC